MSTQQLSRSSSRSERQSVDMAEENKTESQHNQPQNRHESNTAETKDVKSKQKQNADEKDKGKKCKGHKKRHGQRFVHQHHGFYGPMMFGPMGGQYFPGQTGDQADEYEQFSDPTAYNDEGAIGGEYAGPGPWHRFQGMGPMGEHGPHMMSGRGWWRRMMAQQNAMPQGQFGPMPAAMGFPGFAGHMGMNRWGRRHSHHHSDPDNEVAIEMSNENSAGLPTEGVTNTADSSSSSDEDIEIVNPECCEDTPQQNENVKKSEENTDECKWRGRRQRRGPRGGPIGNPMGRCRRRVMRQCFAMGMLHPSMMKPWLADTDSSEIDEKGEKSQNDEENEKPCKKMGKHFRRAMKYRMRMGMFHPFMLKPWMFTDSSSEEDSDVPKEGDSEPKKSKKWQKHRKCRRDAMRECMAMGMLPPGAAKPWMFRESSDSEDSSSDSATEGCKKECKGKKKCCRKGQKGPRKMWRKMMKRQMKMRPMAGQMGPRGGMMSGMGPGYGMGPQGYGPMGGIYGMGSMRGMGPRHGFGPMQGMHRQGPMGPGYGYGPMAMHDRCPMGRMGPRHGYGPMNQMGPEPMMNPFGMMRPKKFIKIMKKIHKENRKAEKESLQKDVNELSKDFEEGMNMAEKKE